MRRKWMPFALAAIIAASAAITPVYADDPPSGSLPSSFEGYRPSGSDAAGGVYLMLTEETIQNWTRPRGESPSQTPSSAAVRRGAKRFQNGVEKISTLTEAVEDMTPGSSPYANISPGMEFIDNILTGIGATSEMVKHPGAERIGTAAEVTQGVIQSQPVVDYIAENKHPIIDFMDQMTIDMNWGITELFGGDGDAYIRNIRDNGYESLAGDFNAFDDVQGQNWQDWRIAQLYQRYVDRDGKEQADTYSARPGYSEHQTGLAFDLNEVSDAFIGTPEAEWLAAHAQEYGFIIRYPADKVAITGYKYEPWHVRYLGKETAAAVYESGLCLEEYLGIDSVYAD